MIEITDKITVDENDIEYNAVRSAGPGGQNVNKVSTAIQIHFDIDKIENMTDAMRARLVLLAGSKLNKENCIVIKAQDQRTQERNKENALNRLIELIKKAAVEPKKRKPKKRSKASHQKRLNEKKKQSDKKKSRKLDLDKE
ncbi:aminoacyl-tRNA hydrolase [bacterium]|jgi:ribosome-associated protein|nr:aminoacyl-tRNA hydrolase [bacterium]MBT7311451.1 aminoacyl-tRNA hydrolase [bacterium]